jgi:hypothetical protein
MPACHLRGQRRDAQCGALANAGAAKIFAEKLSGASAINRQAKK